MGERASRISTIERLAVAFGAAALLALGACSGGSGDDDAAVMATEAADAVDSAGTARAPAATDADESDRNTGGIASTGQLDLGSIGRDVAIEMRVDMTTTDLRTTVDGIIGAVARQGGGVAAAEVDYGDEARDGHACWS